MSHHHPALLIHTVGHLMSVHVSDWELIDRDLEIVSQIPPLVDAPPPIKGLSDAAQGLIRAAPDRRNSASGRASWHQQWERVRAWLVKVHEWRMAALLRAERGDG